MKHKVLLSLTLVFLSRPLVAQVLEGSTGLLQCPSAEMNASGTFMITNAMMNRHTLPSRWSYNTFMYGFDITFFKRIEINLTNVIFDGSKEPPEADERYRIMFNQDRHISGKIMVLQEGEFKRKWIPQLAVGVCDIDYEMFSRETGGNGFFEKLYVVATKHFNTNAGVFSATAGYQFSPSQFYPINAPCAAVTWKPIWLQNRWFSPNFIVEFDSNTPNFGFLADIWDSRFEAMFELQNFQWISFGLRFKLRLSGSE